MELGATLVTRTSPSLTLTGDGDRGAGYRTRCCLPVPAARRCITSTVAFDLWGPRAQRCCKGPEVDPWRTVLVTVHPSWMEEQEVPPAARTGLDPGGLQAPASWQIPRPSHWIQSLTKYQNLGQGQGPRLGTTEAEAAEMKSKGEHMRQTGVRSFQGRGAQNTGHLESCS